MPQRTRRKFLIDASAASLGIALATRPARASALNLPLGLLTLLPARGAGEGLRRHP